jgi:hypothetical protein
MWFSWVTIISLLVVVLPSPLRNTGVQHHYDPPRHIHVSIQGPQSLAVSWSSSQPCTPHVQWSVLGANVLGASGSPSEQTTTTTATALAQDSKIYQYNNYISPWFHKVVLHNVPTNARVQYRCGDGDANWSPRQTIHTAGDASSARPTRLVVVGDLGQTTHTQHILRTIDQLPHPLHAVLVPGDLSYAECNQELWDKWGNIMSVLSSRVPLMVAPGNHDVEYYCARDNFDATAQKFLSYCSRYIMPHTCGEHTEPGEELTSELTATKQSEGHVVPPYENAQRHTHTPRLWYSFDVGYVHVISLCSDCDVAPDSLQVQVRARVHLLVQQHMVVYC